MSNSIAPGSSADVNVRVTALTTNPNVPAQYKTIILKKNLVNGVNTLTQEMMSAANTKYVIKYDYMLGENITVPANCVLKFDGGSINGDGIKVLTGNATNISSDIENIYDNIVFAGTWCIKEILANWFKAADDADKFIAAFNLANVIQMNNKPEYADYSLVKVTCISKIYTFHKTVQTQCHVYFDGNWATFKPASDITGDTSRIGKPFMFRINNEYGVTPTQSHIKNLRFYNLAGVACGGIESLCSSVIENIVSNFMGNIIIFGPQYIDEKTVRNIYINSSDPNIDYTAEPSALNADILISTGDNAVLSNIAGASVYITGEAQVEILGLMPNYLCCKNTDSVTVTNLHTESNGGVVKLYGTNRFVLRDSYMQIPQDLTSPLIQLDRDVYNTNSLPELVLDNVRFYLATHTLSDYSDIINYTPIGNTPASRVIFKNVYGLLTYNDSDHIMGFSYRLKYNGFEINDVEHVFKGGDSIIDITTYNASQPVTDFGALSNVEGGELYVRRVAVIDVKRNIKVAESAVRTRNAGLFSIGFDDSFRNLVTNVQGVTYRIEFGKSDGNGGVSWLRYIDLPMTSRKNTINLNAVTTTENALGYDIYFYVNEGHNILVAKGINYGDYITAIDYKRNNKNVDVCISETSAPTISLFNDRDRVTLGNGKIITKIGNDWVDATGATV